MAEADTVERPVQKVTYEEVMKVMSEMKLRKAAGSLRVNISVIMASGKFGVITKKLCQRILGGEDTLEESKTSVFPVFKGKGVVMDCETYREVKLLEHVMKTVERVLENRIIRLGSDR